MKGSGKGSELTQENASDSEAKADDDMMDSIDPSKWDKTEGVEAKEKVIKELRDRISKFHHSSPEFTSYVDNHLQDQKLVDGSREMDQALLETIKVIEEEVDNTFAKRPKAPQTTHSIVHEIKLKPGEGLPKSPPTYRLSKPDRELIESWIEWMLENKLIQRSTARLVQNLLVVHKPGKEPRPCFDARAINKITIPDGYPPHRMDTLFAKLRDCVIFSALDAASGFFQIPIKEEDRHKTAFRTESGVYEFLVMPFGLVNAPATFQRWMTESFQGLREIIQVYMDDMIVHSRILSEHHNHLRKIFRRCQSQGIKLRLSKCEFLKDELNMLGYVVAKEGIKKNLDKVAPILEYGRKAAGKARLFTIAQVRSFVGMCQWYRSFHHMFADHISKLTDLLKKGKSVKRDWTIEHQIAFDSLKEILADQTTLYYPNENREFIIMTDASKFAIGGALMQLIIITPSEGEPYEEYRVVEYFSRSLIERERNYTVSEKEFLAIVSCVEKWKHFLWQSFKVITDHKPLLSMSLTEKARLQRWALRLSPYAFTIAWLPGEEMKVPDALSRDPRYDQVVLLCNIEPSKGRIEVDNTSTAVCYVEVEENSQSQPEHREGEDEILIPASYVKVEENKTLTLTAEEDQNPPSYPSIEEEDSPFITNARADINNVTVKLVMSRIVDDPREKTENKIWSISMDRLDQFENTEIENLIKVLEGEPTVPDILHPGSTSFRNEQEEDPTLKEIIDRIGEGNEVKNYYIQHDSGILMKITREKHGIVVPAQMENNLLWLYHEHPLAGHASVTKMMEAISRTFYFRDLRNKADKWVKFCQCKRAKARMRQKAGLTLSRPMPRIFAYLVLDLVGEFPRSRKGNTYWLTMMDAFSKDLELVAIKGKSAEGIAKAILENWVCRRGCPVALLTDNAKELTGKVAIALCELLHLDKRTITAYQHTSAGLVENVHKYAHTIMRSANVGRLTDWDQYLSYMRFAILTHELDSCGLSPFQITYGIKPTLPGDLITMNHIVSKSMRKYLSSAHKAMTHTREYFRINREKARTRNRLKRDRLENRYRKVYSKGSPVYVTRPSYTRRDGVKGIAKIVGPYKGPYEIVGVDSHNGVDVDVEGEIKHFNVSQTADAFTLQPQNRPPPSYTRNSGEKNSQGPQLGINLPELSMQNFRSEAKSDNKTENSQLDTQKVEEGEERVPDLPKQPQKPAEGDEDEIPKRNKKPKLEYQIVYDTVAGTYYAAEISTEENSGEKQASLLRAAKKGEYHNIWFDPNNADKTKTQKYCPKGFKPWTVPLDETWDRIGPTVSDLKKLKRKIIMQQKVV